ncbi:thioesterase domain-containing protein [Streptomyces sp. HSW2009]|uniref:thioesterase domain-containing protein n=1 Tax=Streptomyces sp. HSW2009 TaxID=3142890 RepID=UPI0032EC1B42
MALRTAGDRPPLFLVHPVSGSVTPYLALVDLLDPGQPVYAFEYPIGDGAPETVADIAAHYVTALRRAHPAGPYRLGGWSAGGVIAYEMARLLRAAGAEVEALVLLDSGAPGASDGVPGSGDGAPDLAGGVPDPSYSAPDPADRVQGLAEGALAPAEGTPVPAGGAPAPAGGGAAAPEPTDDAAALALFVQDLALLQAAPDPGVDPEALRALPAEQRTDTVLTLLEERALVPAGTRAEVRRRFGVFAVVLRAVLRYRPGPLDLAVTVIEAADTPDGGPADGVAATWRPLAPVRAEQVPGTHHTMLRPPHLARLAEVLGAHIETPRPTPTDHGRG